jgi:hypothetical protein
VFPPGSDEFGGCFITISGAWNTLVDAIGGRNFLHADPLLYARKLWARITRQQLPTSPHWPPFSKHTGNMKRQNAYIGGL